MTSPIKSNVRSMRLIRFDFHIGFVTEWKKKLYYHLVSLVLLCYVTQFSRAERSITYGICIKYSLSFSYTIHILCIFRANGDWMKASIPFSLTASPFFAFCLFPSFFQAVHFIRGSYFAFKHTVCLIYAGQIPGT